MRQYFRHPTDIPIAYRLGAQIGECPKRLRNVGQGGLCFLGDRDIEPGTRILIQIHVGKPAFEADGIVVWTRPARADGASGFEIGVRFEGVETAYAVRMVQQVCHIEVYRRKVKNQEGRELTGEQAAREWIERYAAQFPR
jgi:hypothetical protein